ncbi:MAG: acyltransferase [Solirubrobacteraceae bacterium]
MQASDASAAEVARHAKDGRRVASIDGLRGLAALSVFVFHGWLYTMPEPGVIVEPTVVEDSVSELRLGLVLFFVLSGFLLSRPWFAAMLDERRPPDLRGYVRSRVARIAPAYYVALLGSIALLWSLDATPGVVLPPADELPLFFVFAQNVSDTSVMTLNPPMWSVCVEVSFYAVLPLIALLASRLPRRRGALACVPLALMVVGVLWNWWISHGGRGDTFATTLIAMLPFFAAGMLAALALHGRTPTTRTRRVMIGAGLALIASDLAFETLVRATGLDPALFFAIARALPGAGCALVVGAVAAGPGGRLLGGRVLAGMGTISYGFYLWHEPVLLALRGNGLLPLDPVLGMAVALPPTIALATVSWFVLERPIISWAARTNRRARVRRGASAEAVSGGRAGRREVEAIRA